MAKVRRATHAGSWYTGNGNNMSPAAYYSHPLFEISCPAYSWTVFVSASEKKTARVKHSLLVICHGALPCQW